MRGKRVMIGKRVLNDIQTPSAQVAKETGGIANTGNGMDGAASKGFERPRRLPPMLVPWQPPSSRTASPGNKVICNALASIDTYAPQGRMFRHAVNNDDVGVRYAGNRFPQGTGRQHSSIAEATGSIDDDDFAIPGQAKVLQSVVGQR